MTNSTKLERAVADLRKRISEGGEFPDEAYRVARLYGVPQGLLEQAYDAT